MATVPFIYTVQSCCDYPGTDFCRFSGINVVTGAINPNLSWTNSNDVTDCGQHTVILSNSNPNGSCSIYFRNPPAIIAIGDPFFSVYSNQLHYVYRDGSGYVWDPVYNGSSWYLQQINLGGKTSGPAAAGNPFVSVYGNQLHYVYRDGSGYMWDVVYNGSVWYLQQA
jgi:hypothetical protein